MRVYLLDGRICSLQDAVRLVVRLVGPSNWTYVGVKFHLKKLLDSQRFLFYDNVTPGEEGVYVLCVLLVPL